MAICAQRFFTVDYSVLILAKRFCHGPGCYEVFLVISGPFLVMDDAPHDAPITPLGCCRHMT